jgi:glucosylceramidase
MSKISLRLTLVALAALNVTFLFSQSDRIESWITNRDRSALFENQTEAVTFSEKNNGYGGSAIVIDDSHQMQTIDGFGFALTGGSAELLMKMSSGERANILKELFAWDEKNIGVSYIRLSIGASDLNSFVFSYDDLKKGETDFELKKFNLAQDYNDVIPVLKEILAINPALKILGSPWSAPVWMKTNNDVRGGRLKTDCYGVYALYFVKYVEAMKNVGIAIDAITIQIILPV